MIQIINADVIAGLKSLPEKSVHCVITSPPYWGLRDYGVEGQIGLEKSPEEYVSKMVQVFREVRRVLRDDGTIWLNLGDCYATGAGAVGECPGGGEQGERWKGHCGTRRSGKHEYLTDAMGPLIQPNRMPLPGLKPKDLVGIPWRVAFALQADGWYLRSDIIWSKPNPMPESITDRPTKSHEYVFLLTKKARYFYDADAVREAHKHPEDNGKIGPIGKTKGGDSLYSGFSQKKGSWADYWKGVREYNPAGRNRRTVWEIPTQPTPEAHFATFPEALVEPCIKAGTSERGCCSVCGSPLERITKKDFEPQPDVKDLSKLRKGSNKGLDESSGWDETPRGTTAVTTLGWQATCSCNADTVPCTVLDPFGGSGTTGLVARNLKRDAILIELNPAYVEIARRKLRANEQLFEAVKVTVA